MLMKSTTHNALPIVASMYADKFGVPIILDPSVKTEHTDGTSVHVPFLSFEKMKESGASPEDIELVKKALYGWTAHGCMHVRLTNFSVIRGITAAEISFLNVIEDARIERECIRLYPGTEDTLKGLAEYMLATNMYLKNPSKCKEAEEAVYYYILYSLQADLGQDCLAPLASKFEKHLEKEYGSVFVFRLKWFLDKVPGLQSTKEVLDLTREILEWLKQPQQNPDPEQPLGQDNQGASQGCQGDSQDNQGASQGSQGDGQDNQGASQGSQGDSQDNQGASQGSQGDSQDGEDGQDLKTKAIKALSDAINGSYEAFDPKKKLEDKFNSLASKHKVQSVPYYAKGNKVQNGSGYKSLEQEARMSSSAIRNKLMALVQSEGRTNSRLAMSGKTISKNRMHSVALGNSRVFLREEKKVMPNTAIHLILDLSSSMDGMHRTAQQACYSLALALKTIQGVSLEVIAFKTEGFDPNPIYQILEKGENPILNAGKFFGELPSGSTPLAEALFHSGVKILRAKEEKKIVFVITDGDPNDGYTTLKQVGTFEKLGVQYFGIGIKHYGVKKFFKDHCVINDIKDLQGELFKAIRGKLFS